jgi:transposase InsO family protein
MMARFGFGGAELIASHLALAGFRIAEKAVRNIKLERIVAPAAPSPPDASRPAIPVVGNFVHHVWMMDVTEFKTVFGARTLYFAVVFDAFSRMPLAGATFAARPSGASMAGLFRAAVAAFGRLVPPLNLADLERRLAHSLAYYAVHRPHTRLGNRTPLQAFIGEAASPARAPPRGRRGDASQPLPLRIGFVEPGWSRLVRLTPVAA